ncbi:MAG: LPS-assembly protein LptD [Alphaproteobacteria bacterium]
MNFFSLFLLLFFGFSSKSFALISKVKISNQNLPAILKADIVSGDQIKAEINALGNVEITKDSAVLYANSAVYNKNSKYIYAEGNVRIKNLEIGNILAPLIAIKDDFSEGNFSDARMFFIDGSYLFSKKIERKNSNQMILKKSIFSLCPNQEIVDDNYNAGKLWDMLTISSSTSKIDKENNNFSSYNSIIKFYKLPILYLPYFKFPLPNKQRQSGFLQPSYTRNSNFGFGLKLPYYFAIDKNLDLTTTPNYYFGSSQLILNNDIRHFTKYGKYNLNFDIANNQVDNFADKTLVKRTKKSVRWHIDGGGKFDFTKNFGMDFTIKTLGDRNYLRDYGFDYLAYSTSKLNFDYIKNRDYVGVKFLRFQELENEKFETQSPLISPIISSYHESKPLFFKEKFSFSTNFANLKRADGLQYKRLSLTPEFQIPFNIKGNLINLSYQLQSDLYKIDNQGLISHQNYYKKTQSNQKKQFAVNWRLPLRNKGKSNKLTLEPIANLVISDFKTANRLIPLQDSVNTELSFSNLFANDRISGFDRSEAGKRVSYGLKSTYLTDYGEFDFTAGQAIIISDKTQDVKIRGFADNNRSNIVGIGSFKGKKYFTISYAFQLDQKNYSNNVNQITSSFYYKKFTLNSDYLLIRKNKFFANKKEQSNFSSSFELPKQVKIRLFMIRDFVEKRNIQRGFEVSRDGCCSVFGFSLIENNPSNLIKPQKTFNLNFTIKNL